MLDSITGEVVRKEPSAVIIRTGGIGFCVEAPRGVIERLPDAGEATLVCQLTVRDDTIKLYGFETLFERELFRKLNSVAGVGAATALRLLSELTPDQLIETIMSDNAVRFQKVKGIGAKTAKRIVLELKGKVEEIGFIAGVRSQAARGGASAGTGLGDDLVAVLSGLGYPRHRVVEAATQVLADNPESDNLETLVKAALAIITS